MITIINYSLYLIKTIVYNNDDNDDIGYVMGPMAGAQWLRIRIESIPIWWFIGKPPPETK